MRVVGMEHKPTKKVKTPKKEEIKEVKKIEEPKKSFKKDFSFSFLSIYQGKNVNLQQI